MAEIRAAKASVGPAYNMRSRVKSSTQGSGTKGSITSGKTGRIGSLEGDLPACTVTVSNDMKSIEAADDVTTKVTTVSYHPVWTKVL